MRAISRSAVLFFCYLSLTFNLISDMLIYSDAHLNRDCPAPHASQEVSQAELLSLFIIRIYGEINTPIDTTCSSRRAPMLLIYSTHTVNALEAQQNASFAYLLSLFSVSSPEAIFSSRFVPYKPIRRAFHIEAESPLPL